MAYYDTPQSIEAAKRSRDLQRQRVEAELRRKNRKREAAEANRFKSPLSGRPQKKVAKPKRVDQSSKEYWRNRAIAAEAALRLAGGKPASGPTFYDSQAWRVLRYKALQLHGRKCCLCGATDRLHVDHIKPRSKYPELELRLDNLQVLCEDCNLGKGAWDESDWRKGKLASIPHG